MKKGANRSLNTPNSNEKGWTSPSSGNLVRTAALAFLLAVSATVRSDLGKSVGQNLIGSGKTGDIASESPESVEKKKFDENIKKACLDLYSRQSPMSLDSAFRLANNLYAQIASILADQNIGSRLSSKEEIIELLKNKGYLLAVSPMMVAEDRYLVNVHFHKLGAVEYHTASNMSFLGLHPKKTSYPIYPVENVIVDDVRSSQEFPGAKTAFDGMTISSKLGQTVLIFPDRIADNAKKHNLPLDDYKQAVIINEVSQMIFQETVPQQFLNLRLSTLYKGLKANWTLLHVMEAFSDLATLSHAGKDVFAYEIQRILESTDFQYDFSKNLLFTTINELGIKTTDNIKNLDETQFKATKKSIVEKYKELLGKITLPIIAAIKEM